MAAVPRVALAPGYAISRLLKGGWQLAGGHGAVDRRAALDDMARVRRRRHHDVRLRRHLHRCRGADRPVSCAPASSAAAPTPPPIQVHTKCVPDLGALPQPDPRRRRRRGRPLAARGWAWSASISCSCTGGTTTFRGMLDAVRGSTTAGGPARSRHLGLTNFDTPHLRRLVGCRRAHRVASGAVLGARPAARRPAWPTSCGRARHRACCAYGALAGGFLSERWLGPAGAARTAREPIARQIPPDHRGIGGWDYFQALLAR